MANFSVFKNQESLLLVLFVRLQCIWTSLAWFVRIGIPLISPSRALSIFETEQGDKHYDMASLKIGVRFCGRLL